MLVAEQLVDTADLHAGWRVLDVATGSGNAAIAAARLGSQVVGVDYVPALLERGRKRAAAEGLEVELLEGDAEALPFPDASFDAVTLRLRLDVRPRPRPGGRRAGQGVPAGRNDRARQLDPRRVHRRALPHGQQAHASARGAPVADALGHGRPPPRAVRRRDRVARCDGANLHLALRLGRGARDVLPALVRADPEGVRGARGHQARRPGARPDRACEPLRSPRQTDAIAVPATYTEAVAIRR